MLWACFHFRDLPVHAVFDDAERKSPCAVVDGPQQRQSVVLANVPAQRAGIRVGHVPAVARAVCPALQARQRDAAAERRLLLSLAAWAYRFSSHVSLSEPDALLVEVGASLRLFGGWPALEQRLRGELAAIGQAPALAVTPVPAAARVLAGLHDGLFIDQREPMLTALGCVPVAHSGLGEKTVSLLHHVGMRTLRDVFALPRAELARRIGPAELDTLDHMRGAQDVLPPPYRPPDRFAHRIEFDGAIEAWPPLLFPLRRLCSELALFLAARDGGVQRCEIVLEHEDTAATRIPVELLAPQRDAQTLHELLRSRLERAELAGPASAMVLLAKDLPALCPRHHDLFEPRREQSLDWPALAERLRAHLGDEAVRRLAIAEDHRPEYAWRVETRNCRVGHSPLPLAGEAAPQARVRVALEAIAPLGSTTLTPTLSRQRERGKSNAPELQRPLWLLPRAIPLRGEPPRILAGPERIESGWWDGGDARRDYYVVQTRDGQRAWAYVPAGASDGWMLHGWFA
jgi:protein ImuB